MDDVGRRGLRAPVGREEEESRRRAALLAMLPDPMIPAFGDLSGAALNITRLTVARGSGLSFRSGTEGWYSRLPVSQHRATSRATDVPETTGSGLAFCTPGLHAVGRLARSTTSLPARHADRLRSTKSRRSVEVSSLLASVWTLLMKSCTSSGISHNLIHFSKIVYSNSVVSSSAFYNFKNSSV